MILQPVWKKSFDLLDGKPIVVEPVDDALTTDGGLLPIRQYDELIGLTEQFASVLSDRRNPALVDHPFE